MSEKRKLTITIFGPGCVGTLLAHRFSPVADIQFYDRNGFCPRRFDVFSKGVRYSWKPL